VEAGTRDARVREHLEAAYYYLSHAYELPERRGPCGAAEEIWAAVRHAALAEKYLGAASPPEGWTWRRFVRGPS
jgi:hypothetical protein